MIYKQIANLMFTTISINGNSSRGCVLSPFLWDIRFNTMFSKIRVVVGFVYDLAVFSTAKIEGGYIAQESHIFYLPLEAIQNPNYPGYPYI